jgi:hypothetical protein
MTERESQYPFEKIWIDVQKIQVCRIDHTTKAEFVQANKNLSCLGRQKRFLSQWVNDIYRKVFRFIPHNTIRHYRSAPFE